MKCSEARFCCGLLNVQPGIRGLVATSGQAIEGISTAVEAGPWFLHATTARAARELARHAAISAPGKLFCNALVWSWIEETVLHRFSLTRSHRHAVNWQAGSTRLTNVTLGKE